jgi:diacylglycerol kinase family enzyme
MKMAAVVNPNAGSIDETHRADRLRRLMAVLDPFIPNERRRLARADEIARTGQALVDEGADVLIACGGDGTISTLAAVVAKSGTMLAALPLGTRNNFARDLRIPLRIEDWSTLLRDRPVRRVDLGEVNGRLFINNVSIGLYPMIVEMRDEIAGNGGLKKRSAQLAATLRVLARFPRTRCLLRFRDRTERRLTPVLFIGNNEYRAGILPESRRPVMDSGKLWVCTTLATGPWSLLPVLWHAMRGRITNAEALHAVTTPRLEIAFRRHYVRLAIDGEPQRLETPLTLRSRPGMLKVIAP